MVPLSIVLRVVNDAPQVQLTCVSTYSGWMSRFKVSPSFGRAPGRCRGMREREPEPTYQSARTGAISQNQGVRSCIPRRPDYGQSCRWGLSSQSRPPRGSPGAPWP
ncbi:hypothetical protein SGFS_042460 [Streptomyces graminofaciens]|uniref:Uncharacterized protein n=1 Tax=Streptomyces graminofaciens TaxID=68212 RepID=A0ABM7FAB8_9ACTN|nr:hypothetical protein SGFS_042460 [Streptomyces graminofaciens]